jgi:hypothetical protein
MVDVPDQMRGRDRNGQPLPRLVFVARFNATLVREAIRLLPHVAARQLRLFATFAAKKDAGGRPSVGDSVGGAAGIAQLCKVFQDLQDLCQFL